MSIMTKQFWLEAGDNVSATWYGFQHLVEASALVIVSAFAIYGAYHYGIDAWLQRVLIVAAVIIGLRGAYEFVRCLAHQGRSARAQEK